MDVSLPHMPQYEGAKNTVKEQSKSMGMGMGMGIVVAIEDCIEAARCN